MAAAVTAVVATDNRGPQEKSGAMEYQQQQYIHQFYVHAELTHVCYLLSCSPSLIQPTSRPSLRHRLAGTYSREAWPLRPRPPLPPSAGPAEAMAVTISWGHCGSTHSTEWRCHCHKRTLHFGPWQDPTTSAWQSSASSDSACATADTK